MPRFSTSPERFEGAVDPPYLPLDVVDADGNVVDGNIIYFDTDTGIVVSQVKEPGGYKTYSSRSGTRPVKPGGQLWSRPGQYEGIVEEITLHKAPLTYVPYQPNVSPATVVGP